MAFADIPAGEDVYVENANTESQSLCACAFGALELVIGSF